MVKIWSVVDGKTFDSEKTFLQRLKVRGAKTAEKPEDSDAIIVFCPIVSRFETDITSALSNVPGKHPHTKIYDEMFCSFCIFLCNLSLVLSVSLKVSKNVIVVALHHTYDPNYTVPENQERDGRLVVSCLFFEKKGLFSCRRNSEAKKMVYKAVITQVMSSF